MFARIDPETNWVAEIFSQRPVFHPEVMAHIRECDETIRPGWVWDGVGFQPPVTLPSEPVLTPAEAAKKAFSNADNLSGPFIRGLVRVLANRFGVTPAQLLTAIKNAAD